MRKLLLLTTLTACFNREGDVSQWCFEDWVDAPADAECPTHLDDGGLPEPFGRCGSYDVAGEGTGFTSTTFYYNSNGRLVSVDLRSDVCISGPFGTQDCGSYYGRKVRCEIDCVYDAEVTDELPLCD